MSKRQIIMILGVWVMILFTPGFPGSIKTILGLVTGIVIILVASRIKPEMSARSVPPTTYVEHKKETAPATPSPAPAPAPTPQMDSAIISSGEDKQA